MAYWISIVWRCYKYLTLRLQSTRNTIHYIIPEPDRVNEPDYPSLFRDHEAAFGSALKQTPPPSYQDIMDDQPPPYPSSIVSHVVQETPNRFRLIGFYANGVDGVDTQEPVLLSNETLNPTQTVEAVEINEEGSPEVDNTHQTEIKQNGIETPVEESNDVLGDEATKAVEQQECEEIRLNANIPNGPKDI